MKQLFHLFLDFIFPPLCLDCREFCSTKHFCPECWQLCAPPDPADRCRQCFDELDRRGDLCAQCRQKAHLPVERAYVFNPDAPIWRLREEHGKALAAYAIYQWIRLDWPLPDVIIPMPEKESVEAGKYFSQFLDIPYISLLRKGEMGYDLRKKNIDEGKIFLLIDVDNPLDLLQKAAYALSEVLPKKIYLLSWFNHVFYLP